MAIGFDKSGKAERAIAAAGIGEDPDRGAADWVALPTPGDLALLRDRGESCLPEKGNVARRATFNLLAKCMTSCGELLVRDLVRAGGRAFNYCREATTVREERGVVHGVDLHRREPGQVDDPPEAVAPADEVVARRGGSSTGIESAEHYGQIGSENVREAFSG